jgi:DNA end-binding protein Ku
MRAIWSGTISIGLVGVPVRMSSATESQELRFHFPHKDDLQPIGYGKRESVEDTKKGWTRRKTARKAS